MLNPNYFMSQSNLVSIYSQFEELPDFNNLKWCLQEANAGFVFLHCDGLNYSIVFDADSFLTTRTGGY